MEGEAFLFLLSSWNSLQEEMPLNGDIECCRVCWGALTSQGQVEEHRRRHHLERAGNALVSFLVLAKERYGSVLEEFSSTLGQFKELEKQELQHQLQQQQQHEQQQQQQQQQQQEQQKQQQKQQPIQLQQQEQQEEQQEQLHQHPHTLQEQVKGAVVAPAPHAQQQAKRLRRAEEEMPVDVVQGEKVEVAGEQEPQTRARGVTCCPTVEGDMGLQLLPRAGTPPALQVSPPP